MKEAISPATKSAGQGKIRSLESAIGPRLSVKTHDIGERSRPKASKAKFAEVIIGPRTIFTTEKPRYTTKVSLNKEAMRPKSQFNLPRKEESQSIRLKNSPKKEKVQYMNRQQLLSTPQREQSDSVERKKIQTSKQQEVKIEEKRKYKPLTEGRKKAKKRRRHRKRMEMYSRKINRVQESIPHEYKQRKESTEQISRSNPIPTSPESEARNRDQTSVNKQLVVKQVSADIRQVEKTYNALKKAAKSGNISKQTYERLREGILIQVNETAQTVESLKETKNNPKKSKKPQATEVPENIIKEIQLKDLVTSLAETPRSLLKQRLALLIQSVSMEQLQALKQKLVETDQGELAQKLDEELEQQVQIELGNNGNPPTDMSEKDKVRKDEKPSQQSNESEKKKDKKKSEEQTSEKRKQLANYRIKSIIPKMTWVVQNQEAVNQRRKRIMLEKYKQKKQEEKLDYIVGKDIEPPVPSPAEINSQINQRNDGSIIAIASILKSYGRIESEQEAEHLANRMITIFPAGEISSRPTDRILTNQEIAIIHNKEGVPQAA